MHVKNSFTNSLLSEASYADFERSDFADPDDIKKALTDIGISDAQANNFLAHWKVVSHQPNTDTGFSATVFESLDTPGKYVFAMRGTEPSHWVSDIILSDIADIGADGIALNQGIDLFNYYQRLNTPKGVLAKQYEVYEGITPPPGNLSEYIKITRWGQSNFTLTPSGHHLVI